ncbi:18239_t:CDS:1, partial [Funneliformis geosporum]
IEVYEISQELGKEITSLNIYDAINFNKNAWNSVIQQTIFNCWQHIRILLQDKTDDTIEHDDQVICDDIEIQELIYLLPFDDPIDIRDFIYINDCLKGSEGLTDDEIVSIVKLKNNESVIDPNEGSLEVISIKKTLGCLDDLVLFFEYSSNISINSDELNILKKLR